MGAKVHTVSSPDRMHERHPTVLAVRFVSATEFVTEYAENLSAGGLFIRHAHKLEPLSEITVHIDLAGFESFKVKARVAHVMDEELAEKMGRTAGAGLQLTEVPTGFEEALVGYLARLGRRRDFIVLTENPACLHMLSEAGFRVAETAPGSVTEQSLGEPTTLAVVVDKSASAMYRDVLSVSPRPIPVIGCYFEVDEEPLLAELDRLVVSR